MRRFSMATLLYRTAVIAIFGAGLAITASPVAGQEAQFLCEFRNVNCSTNECSDLCNIYYHGSTPFCQISNGCCNCLF